jgi:hypothetical protein
MHVSTRDNLVIQDLDLEDYTLMLVLDRHGDVAQVTYYEASVDADDMATTAWVPLLSATRRHSWRNAASNSYGYHLDYQVCTECDLTSEEEDRPCAPGVNALIDHVFARARAATWHPQALDDACLGVFA